MLGANSSFNSNLQLIVELFCQKIAGFIPDGVGFFIDLILPAAL